MPRKAKQTPKKGDYFKGTIDGRFITGAVGVIFNPWYDEDDIPELAALHNIDEFNEDDTEDYLGFNCVAHIERILNYEKISKREYTLLSKQIQYKGIGGYSFKINRQKRNPEEDEFVFGCGSVTVKRKDIKILLTLSKLGLVDNGSIYRIESLIDKIKEHDKEAITENNLKQLLKL